MNRASRQRAFFSYLLSLPGALFVLGTARDDRFAMFHARQSLWLWLVALVTPLLWAVLGWAFAWIPVVGGMIAVLLFALVLAVEVLMLVNWIVGMVSALQGRMRLLPLLGRIVMPPPARPPAEPIPELVDELAAPGMMIEPSVEVEEALKQRAAEQPIRDA